MRKNFDTLSALVIGVMCRDSLSGHLFVFFNRMRDRMKVLYWDRSGYCLYYKRLEEGKFVIPVAMGAEGLAEISVSELQMVLEGIDLSGTRRRKRFSLENR